MLLQSQQSLKLLHKIVTPVVLYHLTLSIAALLEIHFSHFAAATVTALNLKRKTTLLLIVNTIIYYSNYCGFCSCGRQHFVSREQH